MNDKKNNNLDEFLGEPYPPLEKKNPSDPHLGNVENEYQAIEPFKARKSSRFRIINADGKSYGCSYTHLIDWVFTPPTLLTLTTASRIFTFEGKNLGRIDELLLDEKIKVLQVFNSRRHKQPASNEPIIERLEIE